ncbi:MAG: Fe-S protein assembly co-chaperone HscB [Rickettsiales bacterium]|nr:Fe-S protein assembly co-chaperone HscB [Rickettsiales bacterium]
MNYFEIFDLEITTEINLDEIESKYLAFQQQFHPDKASTADIEKSILLNEAFEVLQKPFSRLAYILKLNGIDINDDTKAPKVDGKTLQEVFELQEKFLEMSVEDKQKLKEKVENLLTKSAQEINEENYEKAAQTLIKSKYFNKILR